jgi:uncharacterized protein (TIGR03437 family)
MSARYTRGIRAVAGLCFAASFLHAQAATPLAIVTSSLPSASVGASYNQQLVTTGGLCTGAGTASSSLDSGALPPGISVTSPASPTSPTIPASAEQWYLQGVPSAAGTFSFTVHVRWDHVQVSPFDHIGTCHEDAVKSLTLVVQSNSGGGNPGGPGNPTLAVDRAQINTTYHIGTFPPGADTVNVTSTGDAAAITAQSATDSGGPWLSVTALSATTPAKLSIAYSVSGLAQGNYTGRVTVSSGGAVALTIPVTLQVVVDTNVQLQAAPSALVFSAVPGGPDPLAQTVTVTVVGLSRLFEATVSAPPNGKWLTVTPSAAATKATLTVAVTAKDLAAAVYNGTLTLVVGGVPNSSVAIPVTFTIQAPAQKPTISAGGVINAAGAGNAIAPGAWVSLFGTALSSTTRAWRDADFVNGRLPTALDGVSVTIDGKSAAVAFISPGQINVLAADDTVTGLVPVQVKNAVATGDSVLALQQTAAPALFQVPGTNYAAGTHADGSYLAGPRLVAQGIPGTAARVGETIVLYGTGFGATQPPISATALVPAPLLLAHPEEFFVRIGGLDATIAYAGLISPGVYQFNVVVPQVAAGDQLVVAELHGLLTQSGLLLTIQP